MLDNNIILATDAYKLTHWRQYPEDTEVIYSYLESRGGKFKETMFFGLQAYLQRYFVGNVLTKDMIDEAAQFSKGVFGNDSYFNAEGWRYILKTYGGRLPLLIKALPEGMVVPGRNALVTVENTDHKTPWLTNFMESLLLQGTWYPTTVATLSHQIKKLIKQHADQTGGSVSPFHLNDFGFRGVSSRESAGMGGMGLLVNFDGTDNLEGIRYARQYYGAQSGFSVAATEHSTTTIYGKAGEKEAYDHFLSIYPEGVLSLVADSYDIHNAVKEVFCKQLREKILARNGRLVIRPDSGHPPTMAVECLNALWEHFGGVPNAKGYKVLNPKVGVIYGDWINYEMIDEILTATTEAGFATDAGNLVFGMGGALLQQVNRDTLKFAFKCSSAQVGGVWRDVYKQPITDDGKNSKRGRFKVIRIDGLSPKITTVPLDHPGDDLLRTVYKNGALMEVEDFWKIRERAAV